MKYDILNRFTGAVQFTADIECDDSTSTSIKIGLAVKWAVKNSADLSYTNLRSADLSFANLSYTNLRSADLSSANLSSANLSFADLRSASLSSANLSSANLSFADLSFADLSFADLSVLSTNRWTAYIQLEHIRIGCKYHTVKEWMAFGDGEISAMSSGALDWWKQWKPVIKASHKALVNIKKQAGR